MYSNFRCQSSIWRFKTILNFPILRHSFSAVCSMITSIDFCPSCLIEDVLTGITKCSDPGPSIVWGFVLVALYPQLFPSLLGAQDYQSLCKQYGLNTTIFSGDMLQQAWVSSYVCGARCPVYLQGILTLVSVKNTFLKLFVLLAFKLCN